MPRIPFRLISSIALAALALSLLTWSIAPPGRVVQRQVIQPGQMQIPAGAAPETRLLTLDYPAAIRAGESDQLRLTVEVQKKAPAAGTPNIYETHQIIAETHLDMAGMNMHPAGTVSEAMLPEQRITFSWRVRPGEAGKSQGTVWLYLRFIPKDGGPEIRQPVSAQAIEIESLTFFGLHAEAAQPLGLLGIFVSALLGFSFFVDGIKWLFSKRNKHQDTENATH